MDKMCPFTIPYEQIAYIAMTQSEKEIVEAIKEHFSFEDETDQNGGFTVKENKAIEMFNSSCRFDKEEKKICCEPIVPWITASNSKWFAHSKYYAEKIIKTS